jgi:hypothetical protein
VPDWGAGGGGQGLVRVSPGGVVLLVRVDLYPVMMTGSSGSGSAVLRRPVADQLEGWTELILRKLIHQLVVTSAAVPVARRGCET